MKAFTLIEFIVVAGIIAVLSAFITVNLLVSRQSASQQSTLNSLLADIKNQQLKAMTTAGFFGLYFESNRYTLFSGSAYSAPDPQNFVVSLDPSLTLSATFPSSILVFSAGSGEITGFVAGSDSLTLGTETLVFNRYGTLIQN